MRRGDWKPPAARAHVVLARSAAALILAGLAADTAGLFTSQASLWAAGAHLITAGIVATIVAGLAGIISRRSRSGRLAAIRAAGAVVAILLLALSRWVRGHPAVRPDPPIVAAEFVAGFALLLLLRGGWRLTYEHEGFIPGR